MSCASHYTPELRARGYRMTPQRLAILHVLHHSGQHLSPTEVYEQASLNLPGLTEATVYRTLEFLAENGLARPAHMGHGHLVYEITGPVHHHLICRACSKTIEVEHAALNQLYKQLRLSTGYSLDSSHVTLFGLCPDCQS
jgi:Fe2+ or Zn2+ uptake regulation protein